MTVSSRRYRATVYPYVASDDHGYLTSSYGPARGTFFCRFSQKRGTETTSASQAAHSEVALVEFADSVPIGVNDLIVFELDQVQWKVSAFTIRRTHSSRCVLVDVYRNDDEPAVTVTAA